MKYQGKGIQISTLYLKAKLEVRYIGGKQPFRKHDHFATIFKGGLKERTHLHQKHRSWTG